MFDRQEDKEVRRISKKANLDPMTDEGSVDEEYDCSPADLTKISHTPPEEEARRPNTAGIRSVAGGAEPMPVPVTQDHSVSVITAPSSAGSALRRDADGSLAAPKVLPKRNKGSKVNETLDYIIIC